ncbi:type II secretion system F family protein [Proteobacteria bacterium 005FR1]|nr:type II secretion system F family protein [Proteobacteria bacterium 005FR1]
MDFNLSDQAIFIGMVFIASFLLVQSFVIPTFGENRKAHKRLRQRLQSVADSAELNEAVALLRSRKHANLSPMQRKLQALPGMNALDQLIEQAGREGLAYKLAVKCLAFALVGGFLVNAISGNALLAVMAAAAVGGMPIVSLMRARAQRLAKFEEQLPDALVIMSRALKAGHPFVDALNLVAVEMTDPIGPEFRKVFTEINYGGEVRHALNGLMARVGSVTVMVFVTSVLIQKETGGNLSELLESLASVIRERFRFHRKLKTLSAEGRLAAWILSLLPFGLAAILSVVTPNFLPMLVDNPSGRQLIGVAFVLTVVGILWMRKIVRIDV